MSSRGVAMIPREGIRSLGCRDCQRKFLRLRTHARGLIVYEVMVAYPGSSGLSQIKSRSGMSNVCDILGVYYLS